MGICQDLENRYDYDIVEEFLGHFGMLVESLEKLIVALDDPALFRRNINELFRIFHTIKSASGYLMITPVNKVVTLAEEVLEECRQLEGSASDTLINWLLVVSDQLNAYREDLEQDREHFTKTDSRIVKIPTLYLKGE
ncbi:MAG TPA: phosphorelay protein [Campylobacteraceae bacterium]|nr:phosphorelay protein [Campylobacteraceae bacterium]